MWGVNRSMFPNSGGKGVFHGRGKLGGVCLGSGKEIHSL